jgi:predicted HTH domain antitoxin
MSTLTLEIPAEFAHSFGRTDEEALRNARLELAIEMYREGRWSTRKAGEFAGMDRRHFMEVLGVRKVQAPYTEEMLQQDLAYAFGLSDKVYGEALRSVGEASP